jgi:para-nitrobenzyl esterase
MIGIGAITIAERKHEQHGAPVYMYTFTHESDLIIPGTDYKLGVAHALEIPYKFNKIQPAAKDATAASQAPMQNMMLVSGPESEKPHIA